jgi:hypothetical protein
MRGADPSRGNAGVLTRARRREGMPKSLHDRIGADCRIRDIRRIEPRAKKQRSVAGGALLDQPIEFEAQP